MISNATFFRSHGQVISNAAFSHSHEPVISSELIISHWCELGILKRQPSLEQLISQQCEQKNMKDVYPLFL